MKLLSAVAKPTRAATVNNPIVGDTIEITLNDANKLTFEGTDPKVALLNANFIPFIPGNGTFVVNGSNNTFRYAIAPIANSVLCEMINGTYTRAGFVQEIAKAINYQGGSIVSLDEWPDGMDIRTTIVDNILNVNTYFCNYTTPFFNLPDYWTPVAPFAPGTVGVDFINNLGVGQTVTLSQNLRSSSIPKCKFNFEGTINGLANAPNPQERVVVSIAKDDVPDYIQFGFEGDQWFTKIAGVLNNNVFTYTDGDEFRLTIDGGGRVVLYIANIDDVELIYNIPAQDWIDIDTQLQLRVTVFPNFHLSSVKSTLNPVLGTPQYDAMTLEANSYIDWTSELLQVMVGSGSQTLDGTLAKPSVIACSTPLLGNNNIGNILVCLDMECGGHLSGPKTRAVRKFIYTIPDGVSNLVPCTTIAKELQPISLDLRGYMSISRISVQFVSQVTDQLVGFTAPASITLAFLE